MSNSNFDVRCIGCGKHFPHVFMPFCDACNNITEVFYDIASVTLHDSGNPYLRFRDLLPVEDLRQLPETAAYTPLIHAQQLGASLGMPRLYLKDETRSPTGTTKDRMAAVSLAYLYECGVRTFCTSSTGNSSTAYANALARFPDFSMYLFTAEAFRDRVQYRPCPQIRHFVLHKLPILSSNNEELSQYPKKALHNKFMN